MNVILRSSYAMRETSRIVRQGNPAPSVECDAFIRSLICWGTEMSNLAYDADRTGLLLVDPYNDFLSDRGKLFPMLRDIAAEVRLLDNLRAAVDIARKRIFRFSMSRIAAGRPAITTTGIIRIQLNALCSSATRSPRVRGAENGILTLCRRKATSSFMSTGAKAALQTRPRLSAQTARHYARDRRRPAGEYMY
ncbi:hypothetical protein P3T16_002217 [Paraburkholderia sp. GAS42]